MNQKQNDIAAWYDDNWNIILEPYEGRKSNESEVHSTLVSEWSIIEENNTNNVSVAKGTTEGASKDDENRHQSKIYGHSTSYDVATLSGLKHIYDNLPATDAVQKRVKLNIKGFCIDSARFGATFALIFMTLFSVINYQAFFQIVRAELALDNTTNEIALEKMAHASGITNNPNDLISAIQMTQPKSLIGYLPDIGPFENRLIIPKLGANVPIVNPSTDSLVQENWKKFEEDIQSSLRNGVVHYPGSARPGQAGNFFVTGHSSYYPWDDGKYKDVFARLSELEIGDIYIVYYGGDKYVYKVTSKKEVKPSDTSVLDQPTDKRIGTLMTCSPVGTTLRRLIITSQEVDPETGKELLVGEQSTRVNNVGITDVQNLPI